MSSESGIKTFRDSGGLSEEYEVTEDATPMAWQKKRELVIRFYNGVPDDWSVSHCDREANTLKLAKGKRRIVLDFKKHQDIKYGVFKISAILKKKHLSLYQGQEFF